MTSYEPLSKTLKVKTNTTPCVNNVLIQHFTDYEKAQEISRVSVIC